MDAPAALSFTGCYQPYLGDLVFGTADKPLGLAPTASLDVAGSGWAFLYQDATVRALTPDIYVKGGDYGTGKALPEAAVVAAYGGEVRLLPFVPGRSTSDIIDAIRAERSLA